MKTKRYAIVLDTRRCIDCKACTVACKAENDVPLGEDKHRNWVTQEPLRGTFPNLGQSFSPSQCNQCANPPCNSVCPTSATGITPEGIVTVNADKCIGCKYCMLACPYDARYYNEETGVIDKCTFCIQRVAVGRIPACVETCPTKVRVFGDLNDPESEVSLLLAKHRYTVLKPELGTKPFLYYLI
ncbi:MAG: 4Fe-4S dicluster domain-containing protein [Deltaproteobacteria bacterium]|nr:4Fe-4S dicluster domain-containing protein [Deltaproteobacteria bacterium]NCP01896.1 4Fe-4S dicluster domain-containing protein [Deltaproteobacteria bacterium]